MWIHKYPCAHTLRDMDPDMKFDTENNIFGLNCVNVPPKQERRKTLKCAIPPDLIIERKV